MCEGGGEVKSNVTDEREREMARSGEWSTTVAHCALHGTLCRVVASHTSCTPYKQQVTL